MEYITIILIGVLTLVIWSIWNENRIKKNIRFKLSEEWGKPSEEEYSSEYFKKLRAFYEATKDDNTDIDDITWNDLDMDEIFRLINNTQSSIGEEYLYSLLHKPCFEEEELKERSRLMDYFQMNKDNRIKLQSELYSMGKLTKLSVYEYINRAYEQKSRRNLPHYLMALGLLGSVLLIFVNPGLGGFCSFAFVLFNSYQYFRRKAQIERYLMLLSYIIRLLNSIQGIYQLNIPEIKTYVDQLKKDASEFRQFKKGSLLLITGNVSGSLLDAALDYLRMLFHIDLIRFNSMIAFLTKHRKTLNRIYETIGYLDSMLAAASFRKQVAYYCLPLLKQQSKPSLKVIDVYHPLISSPVTNSIEEECSVLITGSNASGKSTFIKTLAINAILSETIHTSLSRSYEASYFTIYSSMALRDNLTSKESYYIVEIKSLKRIIDHSNSKIPSLCFIDEVLRGTNTLERIAASSQILYTLAKSNALVFAATHDIELTHILEQHYSNYHFQEYISGNEISFDYRLYPGRAISKNAIKLLSILGYSKNIITKAEQAAEGFLAEGEWSKLQ